MFDTHCHLTDPRLAQDHDAVMARALAAGVRGCITVATSPTDVPAALALAESSPRIWFTSGMHPLHADEPEDWPLLLRAAAHERCVAWGELGLDGHYPTPPLERQEAVLEAHLALIEQADADIPPLPIVVHCRDLHERLIDVLGSSSLSPDRFVFHCFNASPTEAQMILDFGAWISFTGIVTFPSAPQVAQAAQMVPIERLMVETDAPYLSPEPVRKVRPCEPAFVTHTARFLAQVRGVDEETLAAQLDHNAATFFGIEIPT